MHRECGTTDQREAVSSADRTRQGGDKELTWPTVDSTLPSGGPCLAFSAALAVDRPAAALCEPWPATATAPINAAVELKHLAAALQAADEAFDPLLLDAAAIKVRR